MRATRIHVFESPGAILAPWIIANASSDSGLTRGWYGFWLWRIAGYFRLSLHFHGKPLPIVPQTLIAVIAMALASLVSFQQHRSVLEQRMNSIRGSLSVRSTAVATDKLEEIGARAFDEATIAGAIATSAQLNPITGSTSVASVLNDISDYHGLVEIEKREVNGVEAKFIVGSAVTYVSELDGQTPVGYQTRLKRVTVKVIPDGLAKPDTIRISEVLSCGIRCSW